MKELSFLILLAAAAVVVNAVNLFSADAALMLIVGGFCAFMYYLGYWCCMK